jgi:hypothetical protein
VVRVGLAAGCDPDSGVVPPSIPDLAGGDSVTVGVTFWPSAAGYCAVSGQIKSAPPSAGVRGDTLPVEDAWCEKIAAESFPLRPEGMTL